MKRLWLVIIALAGLGLLFGSGLTAAAEPLAEMLAGLAVVDITPGGIPTLDPLLAKAIVLQQGEVKAALVLCDRCQIFSETSEVVRKAAEAELGIPYENIAIAATHTHQGRDRRIWSDQNLSNKLGKIMGERLAGKTAAELTEILTIALLASAGEELPETALQRLADDLSNDLAANPAPGSYPGILERVVGEILSQEAGAGFEEQAPGEDARATAKMIAQEFTEIPATQFAAQVAEKLPPLLARAGVKMLDEKRMEDLVKELNHRLYLDFKHYLCRMLWPLYSAEISKTLSPQIISGIVAAQAALRPVSLKAGSGELLGHAFNRRFFMQDGSIKYNPGSMNPKIVRPAGPIDPEVSFIFFNNAQDQQPLACVSTYALHVCTMGGIGKFTADYPVYIQRALEKEFGADFVSIFGQSACGDINHVDVSRNDQEDGPEAAAFHGEGIAEVILAQLPTAEESRPSLAVLREVFEVPLKSFPEEEIAWAMSGSDRNLYNEEKYLMSTRRDDILELERLRPQSPTLPIEVQVFRLSDEVAIITLPYEYFVEIGMAIKAASPFKHTMIIELANDAYGYIPSRAAIAQGKRNSLNVVWSRYGPECSDMVIATTVKLLQELKANL
ncbi:MAG: hypothetical protein JXA52_01785 [Planctomycetes bacterium]|nr:hypothetical protein [Planctomycetota bacterium]